LQPGEIARRRKIMRDKEPVDTEADALADLGAATEQTQGTFLPNAVESVVIRDHYQPT
jgi:hypothetical protein